MRYVVFSKIMLLLLVSIPFLTCSKDTPTEPQLTLDQKLQKALDDGIQEYGGIRYLAARCQCIGNRVNMRGRNRGLHRGGLDHIEVSVPAEKGDLPEGGALLLEE